VLRLDGVKKLERGLDFYWFDIIWSRGTFADGPATAKWSSLVLEIFLGS
jgi:hypothetical protein